MGTQNHKAVVASDVHIIWSWSDTAFPTTVTADIGKVFRNSSTNKLYVCVATGSSNHFLELLVADTTGTSGDITVQNDLDVTNDLTVGGATTITGALTVTGEITGGTKAVSIYAVEATDDVTATDGKAYFSIPAILDGANLTRAQAIVITAGTTGATTVDIYNVTDDVDMLTGAISIASTETVGTPGTIDTSNDDVATDDVLRIDVTSTADTEPLGLIVTLEFRV